jgi:thiamine biosynthesis protein ThiI
VESKRGNKTFPMTSPEICDELGGHILDTFPELKVKVKNPDFILNVEIRESNYVYSGKMMAHRGLPVGSCAKGMLLLSGGIDSPVAGFMMASRGMPLDAVYFHSYPYTSDLAKQKVIDLAKIVSGFSGRMTLHVVNFTQIQLHLYKHSPQDMLTVTMRRVMLQIAERLAQKYDCKCLITGESLGQVASQTMEAIAATNEVVKMPILRPLIGLDKQATCDISRKIGAFETSILPYEDCCTVFVAKHPKTHPHPEDIIEAEKDLDIEELVEAGVLGTEDIVIDPF